MKIFIDSVNRGVGGGVGGRRILQIFQKKKKKIRSPGDHRPKYFIAQVYLWQYVRVVLTAIFKFQITNEVNIHNNIQKIIFK